MKNIAIIAGGNSAEREVSIQSGNYLHEVVDGTLYNKFLVIIKGTAWSVVQGACHYPVDKNDFSFTRDGEKILFDFAYITIHGTPGENGMLQGYLDMLGIPHGGCGVLSSALTFDKYACGVYLRGHGVNVPRSLLLREGEARDEKRIIQAIGLPCIVKPNAGGSSFGLSKVKEPGQLEEAISRAFTHGPGVLVERFIDGREFTCGLVRSEGRLLPMPVAEVISRNELFDFQAKYDSAFSEEIIPARVPATLSSCIQVLSCMIYDILRCEGIIRVDYRVQGDAIFMLEVNTTPGMTPNSFIPKMVRTMGGSLREILTSLIREKSRRALPRE